MILSCSLTWTLKIEKTENMDGGTMLKSEISVTFVSLGDLSVQVGINVAGFYQMRYDIR